MNRLLLRVVMVAIGLAGQARAAAPSDSAMEFSLAGMSCATCVNPATKTLGDISGVLDVQIDFGSKRTIVKAKREISRDEIQEALKELGFEAHFPGDPVVEALSEIERAGLDIETVSDGEALRISDHLASGRITIFDYYADWCGPCHLLSPKLERLVLKYQNLALRKVDIKDWESEVGKQATKEFGLPGLPYVRIYGPKGKLLGTVHGNRIEEVEEIIRRSPK